MLKTPESTRSLTKGKTAAASFTPMKFRAVKGKGKNNTKYKELVRDVQMEFAKQAIYSDKPAEAVVKDVYKHINSQPAASICMSTVQRFFHCGKGAGQMGYVMGPYASTMFAIADALDFEIVAQPRKGSKKRH